MTTLQAISTLSSRTRTVALPGLLAQAFARLAAAITGKRTAAPARHVLARGATAWVEQPLGREVRCDSGTLWLTFDREPQDLILEAGESHHCEHSSRLAIHAMSAAVARVA